MTDCLIKAEAVVAGWTQPAIPPVSFTLAAGEVVGLTGPNGVGKSTLLAALAGRARCYAGSLSLRPGLRLALQTQDIPPVAGLPVNGRDLFRLTGADPQGLPAWLADRLDQRVDRLSGGQRHYLALWAILQAPSEVVMLDEPTNNLDRAGIEHLGWTLRQQASAGRAILVVSHDAEFVAAVCDRTIALEPL